MDESLEGQVLPSLAQHHRLLGSGELHPTSLTWLYKVEQVALLKVGFQSKLYGKPSRAFTWQRHVLALRVYFCVTSTSKPFYPSTCISTFISQSYILPCYFLLFT